MNYGPLEGLIGNWTGNSGMDVAPEPDGTDHEPYRETLLFDPIGDVDNAETQELMVLRYHQSVFKLSNGEMFHNESGYLSWDVHSNAIIQSFSIPRGVSVVAQGTARADEDRWTHIDVSADPSTISQADFMRDHARTLAFSRRISVRDNELRYSQTTSLHIYDRDFEHTDENTLTRM